MKLTGRQAIAGCLVLYLGACVALKAHQAFQPSEERGLKFPHPIHEEQVDCMTCHDFESGETRQFDHEFCGVCHEIPEDAPTEEACMLCHTRADYSVDPRKSVLAMTDVVFQHLPHVAQEIDCAVCHPNPDTQPLPNARLKPFCMDCHGKTSPALNECSVCHQELSLTTIPTMRDGVRIAHDAPAVWEQVHGRESRMDPMYCAQCHDQETDCQHCHRVQEPSNHTPSWVRRTHGIQAMWDRQNCAVCHEEDSCLQCHQNNAPTNHRGRFGEPFNTHCVQCHFPAAQNNCTVCHEEISHQSARPSPHLLGIYPPNCARCHPGGVPTRAPHLLNSSVQCIVCHR